MELFLLVVFVAAVFIFIGNSVYLICKMLNTTLLLVTMLVKREGSVNWNFNKEVWSLSVSGAYLVWYLLHRFG